MKPQRVRVKQCRTVIPKRGKTSKVSPTIARPTGESPHCDREEDTEGASAFLELGRQHWESRNPGWLELTRQSTREDRTTWTAFLRSAVCSLKSSLRADRPVFY